MAVGPVIELNAVEVQLARQTGYGLDILIGGIAGNETVAKSLTSIVKNLKSGGGKDLVPITQQNAVSALFQSAKRHGFTQRGFGLSNNKAKVGQTQSGAGRKGRIGNNVDSYIVFDLKGRGNGKKFEHGIKSFHCTSPHLRWTSLRHRTGSLREAVIIGHWRLFHQIKILASSV